MAPIFYALASLKARFAATDKERGATAVEYALVIGLVSIALIVAVSLLSGSLTSVVTAITTWMGNAAGRVPTT